MVESDAIARQQGLMDIAKIKDGDSVVISGAAGSVGYVSLVALSLFFRVHLLNIFSVTAGHTTCSSPQPQRPSHYSCWIFGQVCSTGETWKLQSCQLQGQGLEGTNPDCIEE